MANLKEVRDRIKSVQSTQQITKAMKMVSAAKLRRAQDAIVSLRPYALKLNDMLRNILSNTDGGGTTSFGENREVKSVLIVVVTSNRGLAGAFNTNISKEAARLIEEDYAHLRQGKGITLAMIGKKGNDYLKRRYSDLKIVTDHMDLFSDLSYDHISPVSELIMTRFTEKRYDKVHVVYGKFKNAAQQFATSEQFLPVTKLEVETNSTSGRNADYIFEPDEETLLKELIPSILKIQFQRFLLDTHASEHGARMTAMDKATENAEEMVKDLKISYNKARQEAITKELSEIVGGAAALEG